MKILRYVYDKKILAALAILLLIILSWAGTIDKHADEYTHESIIQAGTAYAAARGINAVVSMLQTSTVGVSIFANSSIAVGELLDPVNDLIERFSSVMVVAFSSLVLQKILLVIVTHELFNSAVTLFGIILIIMVYVGKTRSLRTALRLFILFTFVRFSLGIVVLLNGSVDYIFLDSQLVSSSENLNAFKSDLSELNNPDLDKLKNKEYVDARKIEKLNLSIQDQKDRIAELEQENIPNLKSKLGEAEDRVAETEVMLQGLEKGSLWSMFGMNESKEVKSAKELLSSYEDARDELFNDISNQESRIDDLKDDIASIREEIADEKDGSLAAYLNAAVGNVIDLLVLFILKAVLIPLLFFYALIKIARGIWDVNLDEVVVDNNQVTASSA